MKKVIMTVVILLGLLLFHTLWYFYKNWRKEEKNYLIWLRYSSSIENMDKKINHLKIEVIILEVTLLKRPYTNYSNLSRKDRIRFAILKEKIKMLEKEKSQIPGPNFVY